MAPISTWRLLGLSVAGAYTSLGLLTMINPSFTARTILGKDAVLPGSAFEPLADSFRLLAARDIAIGAAMFAFDYSRNPRAIGQLVVGLTVVCGVDIWIIYKNTGLQACLPFIAGAIGSTYVGYGLAIGKGPWY